MGVINSGLLPVLGVILLRCSSLAAFLSRREPATHRVEERSVFVEESLALRNMGGVTATTVDPR